MFKVGFAYRNGVNIGRGLFAKRSISIGEEVVGMKVGKISRFTKKQWEQFYPEKNLPHDAAILVHQAGNKYVTDWTGGNPPRWYRLNHAKHPNLEMKYLKKRVVWVAIKNIPINQELTFDYGEVPDEWNR